MKKSVQWPFISWVGNISRGANVCWVVRYELGLFSNEFSKAPTEMGFVWNCPLFLFFFFFKCTHQILFRKSITWLTFSGENWEQSRVVEAKEKCYLSFGLRQSVREIQNKIPFYGFPFPSPLPPAFLPILIRDCKSPKCVVTCFFTLFWRFWLPEATSFLFLLVWNLATSFIS